MSVAAHAVAAWAMDVEPFAVIMLPSGGGLCSHAEAGFFSAAVISAAGAAGERVRPEAVEKTLSEAVKTPEDLAAAVATMQRRMELDAQANAADGLDKEEEAIRAEIAAEDQRLQEAREHHAQAVGSKIDRLSQIAQLVQDARAARTRSARASWRRSTGIAREGGCPMIGRANGAGTQRRLELPTPSSWRLLCCDPADCPATANEAPFTAAMTYT